MRDEPFFDRRVDGGAEVGGQRRLVVAAVGGGGIEDRGDLRRQAIGGLRVGNRFLPCGAGRGEAEFGRRGRLEAGGVPANVAALLGEGQAVDLLAGVDADLGERNFKPRPGRAFRQLALGQAGGGVRLAEINPVLISPDRPVLPAVLLGVHLNHDRLRVAAVFNEDVHEHAVPLPGDDGGAGAGEEALPLIAGVAFPADRPAFHRAVGLAVPGPTVHAAVALVALRLGAGGESVVHPQIIGPHWLAGRLRGGGFAQRFIRQRFDMGAKRMFLRGDGGLQAPAFGRLPRGLRPHAGRRKQRVPVHRSVAGAAIIGVQAIELLLGDRVELVIVAGGATYRQSHKHRADSLRPIDGVAHAIFLVDAPALAGRDVTAIKSRRDLLIERRVRQQIAGELFHRELVERLVPVERSHDPVTVGPDAAFVVQMQAVRVAVAGGVEPVPGAMLPIAGRSEQSIDQPFVGAGGVVGEIRLDLRGGGRQAGQGERRPADELRLRRRPVHRQAGTGEFRIQEGVDLVAGVPLRRRDRRFDDRLERPVAGPFSALFDPATQGVDLLRGQRVAGFLGGHAEERVRVLRDPFHQHAGLGVAGNDRVTAAVQFDEGSLRAVESQRRRAAGFVVAVTEVALIRQDRPHVSIEVDFPLPRHVGGGGVRSGGLLRGGVRLIRPRGETRDAQTRDGQASEGKRSCGDGQTHTNLAGRGAGPRRGVPSYGI
ncbi:hypothetical protein LzC2_25900 [Planctomycetes bacterium LzC2]|uniref:Uncharacterized protein n=1 Tax=Alienimonas chondri TaxID=2681879 RepID=A0ABX1VEJ8_9PLAN|nr:hypothetical protein [Alienimonas chondri]